jgi:hypothetical protein
MFKVGNRYKNGRGETITIEMHSESNAVYPVIGRSNLGELNSYTSEGQFYESDVSDRDLIEETSMEESVELTSSFETPFIVGHYYNTFCGKIAKIVHIYEDVLLTYPLEAEIDGMNYSFTRDGLFDHTNREEHDYNLVLSEEETTLIKKEPIEEKETPVEFVRIMTFSNQHEIWNYMTNFGLIQNTINKEIYGFFNGIMTEYDIHGNVKGGVFNTPVDIGFTYVNQWVRYTPVKKRWEDNLQFNTVLCWVSDQDDTFDMLRLVKTYVNGDTYPYKDEDDNTWAFATPLTLENVTSLIYECQKV